MKTLFLFSFLLLAQSLTAQKYTIGQAISPFTLSKNTKGNSFTFGNEKGYIFIFLSNHCPFSQVYEDRIIQIHQKYAPLGYPVIGINSNDPSVYEEDSFDQMQERARVKNYPFSYLFDDTQEVGKSFGASRTPQVFIVSNEKGRFILKYSGAIDNNAQEPAKVQQRFVEMALESILNDKLISTTTTPAIGCAIKWKN